MSDSYMRDVFQAFNATPAAASPSAPMPVAMPAGIDPSWGVPSAPVVKGSHSAPLPIAGQPTALSDRFADMRPIGPEVPTSPAPPPMVTQAPVPPPAAPQVNHPPSARSGGNEYPLLSIPGGGVIKAHELERRGPSLLAAQDVRNAASGDAIDRVRDRNEVTAQQEYALALDQERQARAREAAMQQSFAERDEELAARQADFDNTAKQLGKMGTIDRDRFWASRSTGQKIAGLIEMALSGFNRAPSMVLKRIDDDVKAQEFAYYATRDTAQAKQTAFAQAMQKYQNADAARAMAKAAGTDIAVAQLAQMGAKWKGTEAANRADMAAAALMDERMVQIANGVQFIPATATGRRFYDPRTGLTYSEAEAKAMSGKVDERDFENRKQTAGIGGQLAIEDVKAQNELQKAQLAQSAKADEGAHQISNQLQQAGVPQARLAAEEALAALNKSRGGRLEATARTLLPEGTGNAIMSDERNEREQKYAAFKNAAMKAMFGNVTESEQARADKALGDAKDPASRERAIKSALATLEEIEKNAKAGASPAAQEEFDRRRENAKGNKPAAPPSASKGW